MSVKRYQRTHSNDTRKLQSWKPINITGVEKNYLKCDCINASLETVAENQFLYSFRLDKLPGHKIYKEQRIKLFKREANLLFLTYHFISKMMIMNRLILMEKRYRLHVKYRKMIF